MFTELDFGKLEEPTRGVVSEALTGEGVGVFFSALPARFKRVMRFSTPSEGRRTEAFALILGRRESSMVVVDKVHEIRS
jgi:hypothetical protein